MLTISSEQQIFFAVQPVDFRQGIDGLAALCRRQYALNPQSGSLFVFRNRRATAIKLLWFDEAGFWLAHRRLSRGTIPFWPKSNQSVMMISVSQLQELLYPVSQLRRLQG